jgi:CheY-like chemotaxis protein
MELSPLSVLIVDPHEDAGESMAQLVAVWGYQVRIATSMRDAIEKAEVLRPDVILTELTLPDGDGCDLVRQFREHSLENCPLFVAVTTHGQEIDRQRTADAGLSLHLVKPIEPGILCGVLQRFAEFLEANR